MACNVTKWNSVTMDNESHDLRLSLRIKNFLDHVCGSGEVLETPQMECTRGCGAKWVLRVQLYGQNEYSKNNVTVYLKLINKPTGAQVVTASYEIYILDSRGSRVKVYLCNVVEGTLLSGNPTTLITRSEIHNNKNLYLSNGHLTVQCVGKVFFKKPSLTLKIETIPQVVASNHYSELVKKIYEDSICCDVVLKTGSTEFKCHKTILAATSNYFKAMFGHDMKENKENVVDLSKDLEGEELKALLDFIYLGSDKLPTMGSASYQTLFIVSDMFEIDGLKKMSETELIDQLTPDNALDLFAFSVKYQAKRLKKAAALAIATSLD